MAAMAHEDIEIELRGLDRRIEASPEDTALLLRRADLHRRHRDWERAHLDLATAARLAPGSLEVVLVQARGLLDQDRPRHALEVLDRYQGNHELPPRAGMFRLLEARSTRRLAQWDRCLAAYSLALAQLDSPRPDHFLEHSGACREAGRPDSMQRSIEVLDTGSAQLGFCPALERSAFDLEFSAGQFEAAAARCQRVLTRDNTFRPDWQLAHGQALVKLQRTGEAAAAFQEVLRHIASLPTGRRHSPAMLTLHSQARAALQSIDVSSR